MRWIIVTCALLGISTMQDASPRVRWEGELLILNGAGVDLDDGRVGGYIVLDGINDPEPTKLTFKGSDFWFRATTRLYFEPQHGAMFSRTSFSSANFAECALATYGKGEVRIDTLAKDAHICLKTNAGRFASLHVNHFDPKTALLYATFVTWEKENISGSTKPHS